MDYLLDAAAYADELERRVRVLQENVDAKSQAIAQALVPKPANIMNKASQLATKKHVGFLWKLIEGKDTEDSLEFVMTQHLRVQGMFWGIGAMDLLAETFPSPKRQEVVEFVLKCFDEKRGGFGGNMGHEAHLLYTQHAVYVLAQLDSLDVLNTRQAGGKSYRELVIKYVHSLQLENGSFQGDEWGEVDTRFTFCAVVTLAVLGSNLPHKQQTIEYILSTRNELDGGFGCNADVESHAGYVYTALAALAVLDGLKEVENWDSLAWWLCERQCDSGGLNGRPEKLADVCYSWWVLASLHILNRLDWIDQTKLVKFILTCQDQEFGGIGDHPGNVGDVYHTFFGLCGLSLLGQGVGGREVDPVFALPRKTCQALGLKWSGV
ncbi:hypothetical protein BASA81_008034 [Batrachochytrium salamandrivorans]|nr:hypothetical protein BASA81_008034 [Batrachochytrium salamandrivorans]